MKRLLKISICFLLLLGVSGIQGIHAKEISTYTEDTEVIIKNDEDGIPDPVIYAEALKQGDEKNGNKDGILNLSEALLVTELKPDRSIGGNYSFKGIGKLGNIRYIKISYNNYTISHMEEIKQLKNLTSIHLIGCANLTSPEDVINENLTSLNLTNSALENFNGIEKLKKLLTLELSQDEYNVNNPVFDIQKIVDFESMYVFDISGYNVLNAEMLANEQNIKFLYLNNTYIKDFSFISGMENLSGLDISNNGLSNIEFLKDLDGFVELNISNNNISDISPIKNFDHLYTLFADGNSIVDISPLAAMEPAEDDNKKDPRVIVLSNNKIEDITPLSNVIVGWLALANNKIANVDILANDNFKDLHVLNLANNLLTALPDLKHLNNLEANTVHIGIGKTSFKNNMLTEQELIAKLPSNLANNKQFINANKFPADDAPTPIPPKDIETIFSDKIPSDIIDKINSDINSGIHLKTSKPDIAKGDVFNALKETGKEITFDILDENSEMKYSWSFTGSNITNTNMDINLEIKFQTEKQKEIQKITNQTNMFYVSFAHHGELPGTASLKVKVEEMYKDGEEIYLYYYNEEKGTVEQTGNRVTVKDGYAEFKIDHCSTYFFTTTPIEISDNNENGTPSIDGNTDTNNDENKTSPKTTNIKSENVATGVDSTSYVSLVLLIVGSAGVLVILNKKKKTYTK